MLTYSFNNRNGRSLYEYLYTCIKEDILSGKLSPDAKLPSKRDFAKNHGISVVTVENAYGQLLAEGYIYSLPKKGFYVSDIKNDINNNIYLSAPKSSYIYNETAITDSHNNNQSDKTYTYNTAIGNMHDADCINLVSSHTPHDNFPFSIWAKLMRHVLTYEGERTLNVPPTGGVMQLRQAIAKHLYEFRGITVNPEQIIIGAGTEYLYGLIVQLLGRNISYGLENPSSKKIINIYKSLGVKVNYLDMDEEGVIPDCQGLNDSQIIQISPSHHFPTGIVTSISRRYGLLQWANQSPDRYIIEDDYDSEFRYTGRPIPTLQSIDDRERVIYLNTFSQTISPSMRLGFLVLPPRLLERYRQELGFYACTVPALEQHVLTRFIAGGHYERHLSRMRKEYRDRRSATISAFRASPLASHVTFSEEGAGLHFLLRLDTNRPDEELRRLTAEAGIRLSFLSEYAAVPDPRFAHTLVINYAGLSQSDLAEALRLLTDVLLPLLA